MHIFSKQTSIFFLLVSLVDILSADVSDVVLQKAKTNKPMVLNTVKQQSWQNDNKVQLQYHVGVERVGTFTLGVGELAIGYLASAMTIVMWRTNPVSYSAIFNNRQDDVVLALAMAEGKSLDGADAIFLSSLSMFDIRALVGGCCNIYNACAPANWQITMRPKTRFWFGIAELSIALISGLCLMNSRYYTMAFVQPGCLGLGLFGAYDLIRAVDETSHGISVARF